MDTDEHPCTVWRLITHHAESARALAWSRKHGRIAIGWGRIGDLSVSGLANSSDITAAIDKAYPGITNSGNGGVCLHDFHSSMRKGDLVILSTAKARSLVVEVTGDYEFSSIPEELGDYQHQRRAFILPIHPDALWHTVGGKAAPGYSIRWTLVRCLNELSPAAKAQLLE